MQVVDIRKQSLKPWQVWLEDAQAWSSGDAAPLLDEEDGHTTLGRAKRVLDGLATGTEAPIPAWIGAQERLFDHTGKVRDVKPAYALRQMWLDRQAALRAGLWGALRDWSRVRVTTTTQAAPDFATLMADISRSQDHPALGLRPSEVYGRDTGDKAGPGKRAGGFAGTTVAANFFNARLRKTLCNLARLYDGSGAAFSDWVLPDYEPGVSVVHPWSQAWSVATVATFVDWLHRSSRGSMDEALKRVWCESLQRFRPPSAVLDPGPGADPQAPRPAALPTDTDQLHFSLVTRIVPAQVLEYNATRWQALQQGSQTFHIELSPKGLGQSEQWRKDRQMDLYHHVTRYRGLTVGQVYMAMTIDRLHSMAAPKAVEALT